MRGRRHHKDDDGVGVGLHTHTKKSDTMENGIVFLALLTAAVWRKYTVLHTSKHIANPYMHIQEILLHRLTGMIYFSTEMEKVL